jgi:transcription antitermination factor NusG
MEKEQTWVVLMTTYRGEEEAKAGSLSLVISRETGVKIDDVYVPVLRSGTTRPLFLIEGYIFVRSGYPASKYLDMVRTPYIESLVSQYDKKTGLISQGTISDKELKKMISKATELGGKYSVGDRIEICAGEFKGCEGEIIDTFTLKKEMEEIEMYSVLLVFRSVELILTLDVFSIGDKKNG